MKKHLIRLLILICFWNGCLSVWGNSYRFRGVTMADGLSDLLVNVIYKDSTGFIWVGTDNSLDRFDGVTVRSYLFPGGGGVRKRVYAIAENQEGSLWIGNDMGFWQLNQITEELNPLYKEIIDFPVYSLFSDSQRLYIGSERGLFIKEEEKELLHILPDKNLLSSSNKIKGITSDDTGKIWLATSKGLFSYDPDKKETKPYCIDSTLKTEEYRNIARIGNTLYLGTEGQGIFCFDISTFRITPFVDVGNGIISSLSTDGKDMIYVSTDGNGVHFLSHTTQSVVHSFRHESRNRESIRSNSVYSLLVDKEGIIWIGFYQSGFDYTLYQNQLFQIYSFPPYFDTTDLTVRTFYMEGDKKLIGTRDGLFYIDEKKEIFQSFRIPQMRSDLILSLCRYEDKYYIGTYGGGLYLLDVNDLSLSGFQWDELTFENGHIFCLKVGPDGNLWMGTSAGVYCYKGESKELKFYNSSNSQLPEGNVYEIYFDSTGKGWICAEHGLCIYDPEKQNINISVFPDDFPAWDKYRVVFEDHTNKIYLLPDKGGMIVTDILLSQYNRVDIPPVIHGNAYMSIQEDEEGWFWIGFDDGMIRWRDNSSLYDAFNFKDGIPGQTFLNPSFKDEKGILWFCNTRGLVYVDPLRADRVRQNSFPVVFTDILINGNEISVKEREEKERSGILSLSKDQNNLTFCFSDLTYSDPFVSTYEYRLTGIDKEWKLLNGKNNISYFGLSPGKYQFHVRIPGNDRTESILPVSIYSRSPFYLLVCILLLLLITLWCYYHIRRKRVTKVKEESRRDKITGQVKENEEKYKTKRLSTQECEVLYKRLEEYMKTKHPYTNSEMKLADLAQGLNISSHSLSYLFNQYIKQSYYDYVSIYRIEKFKKLVNDPAYSRYTLIALAELCGFNSRASFFRSFKKYTGITPNEYINSLKKE